MTDKPTLLVRSSRFGEFEVSTDVVIQFPSGLIGFQKSQQFIMLEHKPPFNWLQSVEDPELAFVVVDGYEIAQNLGMKPPIGDRDSDLKENDEFAVMLIVTVRATVEETTVNLKAPLFVNLRTRRGVQIIYDDQKFSTRHPMWQEAAEAAKDEPEGEKK